MARTGKVVFAAALLVALLGAILPASATTTIRIVQAQFVPQVAVVSLTDGITWTSSDGTMRHNVAPDPADAALLHISALPFTSPDITGTASYSCAASASGPVCTDEDNVDHTLSAGKYAYLCTYHGSMQKGILVIQ